MKHFYIFLLPFFWSIFAPIAFANAVIDLEFDRPNMYLGVPVVITLILKTETAANALEGSVEFDDTFFALKRIDDGGTAVSLWIRKPALEAGSTIVFSGITPGGLALGFYRVLRVTLLPLKTGTSTLRVPLRVLAHDGVGTDISPRTAIVPLLIQDKIPTETSVGGVDTDPPEAFTTRVLRNDPVYGNETVVIFQTTDKGLGVEKYLVREYHWPFFKDFATWEETSGVYFLRDQSLRSYVDIKAIDYAGNERLGSVVPEQPYRLPYFVILSIIISILIIAWRRRRLLESAKNNRH